MSKRKQKKAAKSLFTAVVAIILAIITYFLEPWQYIDETGDIGTRNELSVNDLQVHFIDVGQADSILVRVPAKGGTVDMLIDAGTSDGYPASVVTNYLTAQGVDDIEYLIITHPDSDHVAALDEVIYAFDVDTVFLTECEKNTKTWEKVLTAIDEENADLQYIPDHLGETYTVGDASFKVLGPTELNDDANECSITIRLDYGETSFLFSGDAEKVEEAQMLKYWNASEFDCDVFKAGHHGSGTSSSEALLKAATPALVVISCGEGNSYGHPHQNVLDRFANLGIDVLRTDLEGTIILCSDKNEVYRLTSD